MKIQTTGRKKTCSPDNMGVLRAPLVGITMKELVRRAIVAIRNERQSFEVKQKRGYGGKMNDLVTSADRAAQEVYIRTLTEGFPGWGIVAEEDSLVVNCENGEGKWFTVDGLDGTKAFVRGQSHGVGTMISLSENEEVISAFVGDVNTQEIFGFRHGSNKVHRISEYSISRVLGQLKTKPLRDAYILLRDPERVYSSRSCEVIKIFKNMIVDGGSIGTWMARLWKDEVGAALVNASWETPWDANPVFGISKKLGFVFLKPSAGSKGWTRFNFVPLKEKYQRTHDVLIIHESKLRSFGRKFPIVKE